MNTAATSSSPALVSGASGRRRGAPSRLERVTVVHVGVLLLLASWAFGGGATWARSWIAAWGSLGVLITLAAALTRDRQRERTSSPLPWLWPLVALNVLILASCLNPSFSAMVYEGQALLAFTGARYPSLPSTAHPPTSLEHLWLFDAIYLSCFNLALTVRRRRSLRQLLVVAVVNAVILSVFGTFQKLVANGLFFGLVPAPNPRFFATFVYGNHWGAYLTLLLAAGIGLVFHYARRAREGDATRSPVITGVFGLILMAITPALAGSRAGIALVAVLLGAAAIHTLLHLARRRRAHGHSAALPVAALLGCAGLVVGGTIYLGRESLQERWQETEGQLRVGLVGERLSVYRDTLRLAESRPVFGWGLGSFEQALQLIRPRPLEANRQYEHSYVEAHSDWLQAFAELGLAGAALVALCGLVPLRDARVLRHAGSFAGYLLAGCGLIVAYAGVEFPFANPAVTIAFWMLFFAALQYVRLSARGHPSDPPCFPSSS